MTLATRQKLREALRESQGKPAMTADKPSDELKQARTHLGKCQKELGERRFEMAGRRLRRYSFPSEVRSAEADVLAALSWVWDAQERAGLNNPWATCVHDFMKINHHTRMYFK